LKGEKVTLISTLVISSAFGALISRVRFFPSLPERIVKASAKRYGQFVRLALFVECDGLTNVVHYHLARIAPRHVLLKLLADSRVYCAIYVFVQQRQ
jgi:hypothetical protein